MFSIWIQGSNKLGSQNTLQLLYQQVITAWTSKTLMSLFRTKTYVKCLTCTSQRSQMIQQLVLFRKRQWKTCHIMKIKWNELHQHHRTLCMSKMHCLWIKCTILPTTFIWRCRLTLLRKGNTTTFICETIKRTHVNLVQGAVMYKK